MHERILILDFGSQYTQLIARRIRELNVYSEIVPYSKIPVLDESIKGVILSGSPFSCRDANAPVIDFDKLLNHRPVLGICYGAQLMAQQLGGNVAASTKREYGRAMLNKKMPHELLLEKVSDKAQVWMSHGDTITKLPDYFEVIATTEDIDIAAFRSNNHFAYPVYGVQFHPEVAHTLEGKKVLEAFVFDVCKCKGDWTPASFVNETIDELKNKIGSEQVVLGLSGGVDSSVAAILISRAIGKNLHCIFVDNGLLRKNEYQSVLDSYMHMGLNVTGVDASDEFLDTLAGVSDPEKKRKIIGKTFIDVFDREAQRIKNVKFLAQGTIYPDVIESISVHGPSMTIKSHHNVGGLPDVLKLSVVEPLRFLFKDEVRKVGAELKIDPNILNRHPFPGPGLSIRILGDITKDKLRILRDADEIFINNLKKYDQYDKVWQAATILLPIQSVGVMGDERTYEFTCVLRAVTSVDGMTADWARLPNDFLATTSSEITNQVRGINRVVYDISSKPPSTIEWE